MGAMVSHPSLSRIALVVCGVALGVLDVQQARTALDRAMHERSARSIGAQLVIGDPWFVARVWRERLADCSRDPWCRPAGADGSGEGGAVAAALDPAVRACLDSLDARPDSGGASRAPLGTPLSSAPNPYLDCMLRGTPRSPIADSRPVGSGSPGGAWWGKLWPVVLARVSVLPIVQTGWALLRRGWTARIVFALSVLVALLLAARAGNAAQSLPAALILGALAFVAASAALSFGFNLLLAAGNAVAGYWGVLVALASGTYVLLELAGKLRELAQIAGGRRGGG